MAIKACFDLYLARITLALSIKLSACYWCEQDIAGFISMSLQQHFSGIGSML